MWDFLKRKHEKEKKKLKEFFAPAPQVRVRDVARDVAKTAYTPSQKIQAAGRNVATGFNNLFNPNTERAKQNRARWDAMPKITKKEASQQFKLNSQNDITKSQDYGYIPIIQAVKQRSFKPFFDKENIKKNLTANISDPMNVFGAGVSRRLSAGVGRVVNKAIGKGVSSDGINRLIKFQPNKTTPLQQVQQPGRTPQSLPNKTGYTSKNPSYFQTTNNAPKVARNPNAGNVATSDIAEALKSTPLRKVISNVQNSMSPVQRLTNVNGVKLTDQNDPYLAETLFHGRVGARMEGAIDQVKNIDKGMANTGVGKDVDDYLKALHAPERNAVLGDGAAGMTNNQAQETLQKIQSSKNFAQIEQTAGQVKKLHSQTLDMLKDGLISEEMYANLRKQYPNHVPLNRILEDTEDIAGFITGGKGYSVKNSGLKRAVGSDKQVDDIMTNITTNLQEAIIRSEKNKYGQAVLKFVRDNDGLQGLFTIEKPKAIGKGFDDKILTAIKNEKDALIVMENGKPTVLRIHDEGLAEALRGVSVETLQHGFKTIGAVTRMYAGLATRFNPDFAFSNIIRDTQEAMVYLGAEGGAKSALKTPTKIPASAKDVFDGIRGKATEGARLYKQMIEDGGTTGGMGLSTRKEVALNIEKIRKLNRSKPRQALNSIVETVDNWNQIFEDSTRLSVYKDALERGLSRPRAAQLAKEATINFNRKGKGTPMLNSLYMFSNASIQGSTKMIRAMKNPKVAAAVTTAVGMPTIMFNRWNDSVDPEWRDKVKSYERAKHLIIVSPRKDEKGDFEYIKIPVGWGISPIKTMVDVLDDLQAGHTSGSEGIGSVVTSILESYNPVGGGSLMQAVTPTIGDVPMDIYSNKNWYGGNIHPEFQKGKANKDQYFSSLDRSATGKASIKATDTAFNVSSGAIDISPASLNYAIESYASGAGRFIGRAVNMLKDIGSGEDLPAQDTPFINRFYKEVPEDQQNMDYAKRDAFYKKIKKIDPESPEYQQEIKAFLSQAKDQEEYEALRASLYFEGISTKGISTDKAIEDMKPYYDKIQKAIDEGDEEKANGLIEMLSPEGIETYSKLKSNKKREATVQARENLGEVFAHSSVKDRQTKLFNDKMNKVKESDLWKNASGDEREKFIKKLSTESKNHATAQMIQEVTGSMSAEEKKAYFSELKKAGILTKAIFDVYTKSYSQ